MDQKFGPVGDVYGSDYQKDSVDAKALQAYDAIADIFVARFRPRTAVDVGCGGGALIRGLRARGVDAWGLEGAEPAVELLPEHIRLHDLRFPLVDAPPADLVTCFDVAEHVEAEFSELLTNTLVALCKRPGVLLFGAAPPGQPGLGHVNCRPPEEWTRLLAERGASHMPEETTALRADLRARPHTGFRWWVERNLQVYRFC